MKNTKTTLAGIGAILVAVGGALKALFAAVTAGIGLIWAKDAEKKAE
jgi:hypothetical protein